MKLTVAGAALNQTPIDWEGNLSRIVNAIQLAKEQQVDILCLPELCITGYGCEDLFLSDWIYQKALDLLPKVVEVCQNITVAVSLPIIYQGHRYDTACLIHDQKILGFTAKQFLANDGVHYEPRWFTPWPANQTGQIDIHGQPCDFGDLVYEVHGIKVAFEICEDAWRENLRPGWTHKIRGVDLILNPSASHFAFGKTRFRERLVVGGSSDFGCAYVFSNLLGNEAGRMIYDGEIMIAQKGQLLKKNNRLSFQDINLLNCQIDFDDEKNSEISPVTDDYDQAVEFVKAESLALYDYLRKSRSNGFVLSLSGGADSSCCAILVSEMIRKGVQELGIEAFLEKLGMGEMKAEVNALDIHETSRKLTNKLLITAYQGTVNSSSETLQAASTLADSIGATFHEWKIDDEVGGYTQKIEEALRRELTWERDDITLQNVQARARNPAIWMLANIHNALLLTTSNRSEGDVGYATMDGDTSGSIAPIAGVDKYFLLQWLQWAEEHLDYPGLQAVNQLSPSAELRPLEQTQTDEADLMPYSVLVEIERLAIRDRNSPLEIFRIMKEEGLIKDELLKSYITKFFRLWSRNQWKRERIAPSFHIDDFNVDPRSWCRFPILSGGYQEELEALKEVE